MTTHADQCMFGLTAHAIAGSQGPAKKPTQFLSSAWYVLEELTIVCDGSHTHEQLHGGSAAGAAEYRVGLCQAISRGLRRQIRYEETGLVSGRPLGRGEVRALAAKLERTLGRLNQLFEQSASAGEESTPERASEMVLQALTETSAKNVGDGVHAVVPGPEGEANQD